MQEKSQATTVSEASTQRSIFPFLLEYKWVCTLFTCVVFVVGFFLLYPLVGPNAGALSVLPVMMVGWGFGARSAFVAGLLSLGINTLFLNLVGQGPGGWDVLIREAGAIGPIAVVFIGMVIGKLSHLTQQLQQEIHSHKQTEDRLAKSQESLELRVAERTEELSKQQELLFEGQSLAKFGTIKEDLQTGERWWSDEVYNLLGITPQIGTPTVEVFLEHVHPHDRERLKELMARAKETENSETKYRMIRSSGEELTVHSRAKVYYDEAGNPARLISTILDITERKQAQEALRRSEERLLAAQEVAHFGSFERNLQTGAGWWSDEVYRILGLSRQECEPTFDHYLSCVHPEDLERVKARAFEGNQKADINRSECRIIRPSGEIRTVYNQVKTFKDESGTPIRTVGTILDITERKQAEREIQQGHTQLLALSRRLIQTQEQERRRIALELHDQLGQELALLSIEIEQLIPKAPGSQAKQLQKLTTRTKKVSSQVQTLSHQLHPSQLQHLGLVAAARSLCREVSQASNIQIDFSHSDVSSPIPEDVSICLYRVLQESLGNMVKHSGTQEAQVTLTGRPDEIHLDVCDSGVGFDPQEQRETFGLGLISMRERLNLVGGELLVESQPSGGTQIKACVPLNPSASPIEHPTEVQEA
jgi:PAS domain S-box-containing protein